MAQDHYRHGRHGNPADLALMVKRQLDPARAAWQKPERVIAALGLRRGRVVAEIGSGPGYFTLRLARAVGPSGRVYAVDPEPAMLEALRERLARSGLRNVTPILGLPDDPLLPPASCDLVLIVNAYHHFADGRVLLRCLTSALRPRGRVVNVDWAPRETPVGPPLERRVAPDAFLREARRAGLSLIRARDLLPHQYFLVLERARRARDVRNRIHA